MITTNKAFWAAKRGEWELKASAPNRMTRRTPRVSIKAPALLAADPVVEVAEEEPSYRDLQAQAKELDIPANQSADDLKAAIAEASDG